MAVVAAVHGAGRAIHRGGAGTDACGIGDREVIMEGQSELRDSEQQKDQERHDERELDDRLTAVISESGVGWSSSVVIFMSLSVKKG